ncbi:MAG: flippase [Nitrososphaerales archaeon]
MSQAEIARRSTRGSFALFAGNLATTVVSFVAITLIARLLGPSQYGVYALAILVPNILLNFLGFGMNSGITRYAALHLSQGRPDLARRMTMNGVAFVVLSGVVLSAVSAAGASLLSGFVLHRPDIASSVRLASLLIFGQAVFQAAISALLGWSRMGEISATNVLQSLLRFAIAVPLIVLGFAVTGALLGNVLSVILGGLVGLAVLVRRMAAGDGGVRLRPLEGFSEDVRSMLSYGATLFVGQFAANVSTQFVVVVLAAFASDATVGFYQSANNFVTAITLTSGAMSQALFPAFAHLDGVRGDLRRAFAYAAKYTAFVLTPIVFLLMGASVQIIGVPLGPSYRVASGYLVILAFSNVPFFLGHGVLQSFFNGVGRPRLYTAFSVAAAVVLVGLAPILAIGAGLGVPGLVAAILASNLTSVVAGLYLASRYFHARTDLSAALSILAASILAFLSVLPIDLWGPVRAYALAAEVAVFAAVYLTAAPLLRAVGPDDLDVLDSAVSGLGRFRAVVTPLLAYERFVLRRTRRASLRSDGRTDD